MTNDVTTRSGGSAVSKPRLNVKALMTHHLTAFKLVRDMRDTFALIEKDQTFTGTNVHGHFYALNPDRSDQYRDRAEALLWGLPDPKDIDRALAAVANAVDTRADEPTLRLLVGAMLDGLRSKPTESSPVYIDALMFMLDDYELTEGDGYVGTPPHFSTAVIAAAVRDVWSTQTFPPSIHEFIEKCRKHRLTLDTARHTLKRAQTMHKLIAAIIPPPKVVVGDNGDDIPF
jgi:hypothetical protein